MIEIIIGKEFTKKVIPLIDAAKVSLKIVVFEWRWYPNDPGCAAQLFNQAVIRAKKRGVKVQVVTNLNEGARMLREQGCEVKKLLSTNLMHVKLMIIDDGDCIIGSHNYTQNAFTINYEVSVILKENIATGDEKKRLLEFFNFLIAQ